MYICGAKLLLSKQLAYWTLGKVVYKLYYINLSIYRYQS